MIERIYTKKPGKVVTVNLPRVDRELLQKAAIIEEISQSEFLRLALRERGARVVSGYAEHPERTAG